VELVASSLRLGGLCTVAATKQDVPQWASPLEVAYWYVSAPFNSASLADPRPLLVSNMKPVGLVKLELRFSRADSERVIASSCPSHDLSMVILHVVQPTLQLIHVELIGIVPSYFLEAQNKLGKVRKYCLCMAVVNVIGDIVYVDIQNAISLQNTYCFNLYLDSAGPKVCFIFISKLI
jgi:hypothetical protein